MARLCGPPALPTDRQREHNRSNWAESLQLVLGDRPCSERGQTCLESVVSELKKLSEGQAKLARELEVQHEELIKRFDQQYGLLASGTGGDRQPAVQPSAADHKEPAGLSMSVVGPSSDVETRDSLSPHGADHEEATGSDINARGSLDATGWTKRSVSDSLMMVDKMETLQKSMGNTNGAPGLFTRLLSEYGEMIMGAVIVLNMIVLCVELQLMGELKLAYDVGIVDNPGTWEEQEVYFVRVEFLFTLVYTLELLVHLKVSGLTYLKRLSNMVDAIVVLCAALQAFILRPLRPGGAKTEFRTTFMRVLKLARIIRVARMLRFMNTFVELRILIQTIWSSRFSLIWSVMLILVVVVSSGIASFQMTALYIQDESIPDELRLWLYEHFGTWTKACYTMFEATFSSAWTGKAFIMTTELGDAYVFFWMFHVVVVNFALMRIVSALFLKQTMQVAAIDAEEMALKEMKTKEEFRGILNDVFKRADTSGDGAISAEEFAVMMVDPQIEKLFRRMQLSLDEVKMLFAVLVDDDDQADYDEFLSAALEIKNNAKGIHAVQILHGMDSIKRMVFDIASQGQAVSDGLDSMAARFSKMDHAVRQLQICGSGAPPCSSPLTSGRLSVNSSQARG